MKRRAFMLILIAVGALIQQLLPGVACLGGMKFPVLGSMALFHALHKGVPDLWMAVVFAAVLQDGLSLGSFGPALLSYLAMGTLIYRIRKEIFADGLVTQLILGLLMGLFVAFVTLVFHSAIGQLSLPAGRILLQLLGAGLLGLLTQPVVARVVHWIEAAIPQRREFRWQ